METNRNHKQHKPLTTTTSQALDYYYIANLNTDTITDQTCSIVEKHTPITELGFSSIEKFPFL